MEMGDNEINSTNTAEAKTNYTVSKDSIGNFLFYMRYDKIKIHTKKGDVETEADADNAALSINPVEKMLGILKEAKIVAIVGASGEIKDITGYKELGEKLTAGFVPGDIYSKNAARNQWEKLIGGNIFKGGVDKLFTTLPDSTIKPGDSWTSTSKQAGEIPVNVKSTFTLKEIENNIAVIQSVGDITSIDQSVNPVGVESIKGEIKGTQKGTVELNIKTGMVVKNDVTTKIEGTMLSMGVEVPIRIHNTVKLRQLP